ncbi:DUF1549 domain-containing protein [Planctomicrobium piriforme]|uniref:DUF1549 domain-containing protein n=1 Tax=Planctomicrobium piriforme TaxID=1576369 RepID=A0A1I3F9B4_9PLAN|nr:DUF1549 domain-containing protein [Planctomicrobium piriforme]SFI07730.1 Protein of unknown function [Planctomicrobium piriforme]
MVRTRRLQITCIALLAMVAVSMFAAALTAAPKPAAPPRKPRVQLPDLKTPEDKVRFLELIRSNFPATKQSKNLSFSASDLDERLDADIAKATSTPFARVIDDETFIRRATIDLTGHYPTPAELQAFIENKDPKKRAKLVDQLLETDAYARKWARYWREVIFHGSAAATVTTNANALEDWFFEQFKNNTPWDRVVAELVSAYPKRQPASVKNENNAWYQNYGPNNFVLACDRVPETIASQTARIFMGISIGCAECHDHPFDNWKREQFHELAAFFTTGKYLMTDQKDPTKKIEMYPKFLLGEDPEVELTPDQRRVAAAAYLVYNPANYWFSRAYVNRIWNELLGDGFYSVDSLGPDKECSHQLVANRLGATFRYSGFDTKWLFRTIMNTHAYQREISTIDTDADLFTAVRPARLRHYEVADNLERLVGPNEGLRRQVKAAFLQDPSMPQRDLEGSIQQALLMMNNGYVQSRLATGDLKNRLVLIKTNPELITTAFLEVVARHPTDDEKARFDKFINESASRDEAAADLLWILTNSAEFITKR